MDDTAMGCRNFDSVRAGVKRFPARASLQQLPHACMHVHTHTDNHTQESKGSNLGFPQLCSD